MSQPVVFIVGAPRSGTTFLQNLIGSHPRVASSQETDLFTKYVGPLRTTWEQQLPSDRETWQRQRHKGLPAVLTEEEFDLIVADVIDRVHGQTIELKPGAEICLVKVPQDCTHAELILRYVPDARFIHMIRDGRDVVASQIRAAQGWGREWAPRNVSAAAARWRLDVEAGRSIRQLTDAYLEVRYEDLLSAEAPALLRQAFAFAGIDATDDVCSAACAEFSLGSQGASSSIVWGGEVIRRLGTVPSEPRGFLGEGGPGAWEKELDLRARGSFQHEAGDLLRKLGYATSSQWVAKRRTARAVASFESAVESVWIAARYRLRRALVGQLRIASR